MNQDAVGFPLRFWIGHVINLSCIFLLMRKGVEIFGLHRDFYWNDDTIPGNKWAKFGKSG
ncbi:MAG: hypothetical protein ABI856_14110 [Nitrospira sp.]